MAQGVGQVNKKKSKSEKKVSKGPAGSGKQAYDNVAGQGVRSKVKSDYKKIAQEFGIGEKISKVLKGESTSGSGAEGSYAGRLAQVWEQNEDLVKAKGRMHNALKGTVKMSESDKEKLARMRFKAHDIQGNVYVFGVPGQGGSLSMNNDFAQGNYTQGDMNGYCVVRYTDGGTETLFSGAENDDEFWSMVQSVTGLEAVAKQASNKKGNYLLDEIGS